MIHLLINIFAFILAIGILVTFHELGHYSVAKWFGVKVLRFSVGFGKPLYRVQRNETEYVLAAIPLGGYVKMLDEREGAVLEDQKPYAFNRQPVWIRFLIVLAGPIANFIFAILAYWVVYMIGITGMVPLIGEIAPHSIAAHAEMSSGEEIVAVNRVPTSTWSQIYKQLTKQIGETGNLEIETKRSQQIRIYDLDISHWELKSDHPDILHSLGIIAYRPAIMPIVEDIREFEPASEAGVEPGDLIRAVNGKPITDWKQFTDVVTHSIDIPVRLTIDRKGESVEIVFKPRARESDTGEILGFAGLIAKQGEIPKEYLRIERFGPIEALQAGVEKTGEFIYLTFEVLGKMVTGKLGLKTLSGPLTIAQGAGESIAIGWQYYLGYLALISISLGVLNLLPIPILDGGHLLYYTIESVTGRPVSERIQVIGYKIGLMLLIFLMTIAFYNDIARLFG